MSASDLWCGEGPRYTAIAALLLAEAFILGGSYAVTLAYAVRLGLHDTVVYAASMLALIGVALWLLYRFVRLVRWSLKHYVYMIRRSRAFATSLILVVVLALASVWLSYSNTGKAVELTLADSNTTLAVFRPGVNVTEERLSTVVSVVPAVTGLFTGLISFILAPLYTLLLYSLLCSRTRHG